MDPVSIIMQYIVGRPNKAKLLIPKYIEAPASPDADDRLTKIVEKANAYVDSHRGALPISNPAENLTDTGFKEIEVQYNPKSLDFRGLGGLNTTFNSSLGPGGENQINTLNAKISTTLSCELVYADVNSFNAFMDESFLNMNMSQIKGAAMNIYMMAKKKSYSVQPVVDGMISLLAQQYTRQVIFAWDNTIFRGQLTRVDANYKMFNKWGDPIIATINIEIRQGHEEHLKYDSVYWRKQFKKVFEEVQV